jgi:hypothetical protein
MIIVRVTCSEYSVVRSTSARLARAPSVYHHTISGWRRCDILTATCHGRDDSDRPGARSVGPTRNPTLGSVGRGAVTVTTSDYRGHPAVTTVTASARRDYFYYAGARAAGPDSHDSDSVETLRHGKYVL